LFAAPAGLKNVAPRRFDTAKRIPSEGDGVREAVLISDDSHNSLQRVSSGLDFLHLLTDQ
jgi:hypothetical protein